MSQIRQDTPVLRGPPSGVERRRPGRIEAVSPALIPLLRGEHIASLEEEQPAGNDLGPAIGIGVSVVLSMVVWVPIVWALLRA